MSTLTIPAASVPAILSAESSEDKLSAKQAKRLNKQTAALSRFERDIATGFDRLRKKLVGLSKGKGKRKRTTGRVPSGYAIFSRSRRSILKELHTNLLPTEVVSKIAAEWNALSQQEKDEWIQKGKDAKVKMAAEAAANGMQDVAATNGISANGNAHTSEASDDEDGDSSEEENADNAEDVEETEAVAPPAVKRGRKSPAKPRAARSTKAGNKRARKN